MKPTYKESYDKIIDAYFKDEIEPMDAHFCFCGTLCGKTNYWYKSYTRSKGYFKHNNFGDYTGREYYLMEEALLSALRNRGFVGDETDKKNYEAALFAGMSAALDVLKQIHIECGEVIDEATAFTKRILQSTTTN